MATPRGKTLALGYDLGPLGGDLVFSVARFHTDLVRALIRRGEWRRLVLVAAPFAPRRPGRRLEDRPAVQAILRAARRSVAVDLTDYPTLASEPGAPPTVLHEGSWQDMVRPFRLRRLHAGARFPVTVSHHGLHPADVLRDFGLDLLLSDARPYDAIVCTSRSSRAVIRRSMDHVREALARSHGVRVRFRGKLEVIPLGVDTRAFRPRSRRPLRRRLGLPEEAVVLLVFGRFDFLGKADLLPLLRAFRFVVDDHPGVPLLLVVAGSRGKPAEEELFRRYAAELGIAGRVRRLTSVAPEDDPLLHAAADVFVCPADGLFENFGLAPVQAMACGVPQVVSDWDGHRETVVHGETGFLIPTLWGPCEPGLSLRASFLGGEDAPELVQATAVDVRALREQVGALVRSPPLRAEMGRRSRERAASQFSIDAVAARYDALWADLVREARAHRGRPAPWADVLRAPILDVYRGHVTRVIDDGARLRSSEAGARVLAGEEAVPLAGVEPSVIEREVFARILAELDGAGRRAGDLVTSAARACRRRRDVVWSNVMWLLKYGYVEVERASGRARR